MFDSITIHLGGSDPPDFGLLAESLLFYGHVTLVVNSGHLKTLLRVCGYEVIRDLLNMGTLSINYLENGVGVRTTDTGHPNERHDFIMYDVARLHLQNCLPETLRELIGKNGKARRVAEQLKRNISASSYTAAANDLSIEDIISGSQVKTIVARTVHYLAPEYSPPDPFVFDVVRDGPCVRVSTNLDFNALNSVYHRRVDPQHSIVSVAYLLSMIHQATADLQMAAASTSEMALSPINTLIATIRLNGVLQSRLRSEEALQLFQDFAFDDARAVREAINERHRNMAELATLVADAQKFKKWVNGQPENADLRKAYLSEVAKLGWSEKLPRKTVRWAIFTTTGIVLSALTTPAVGLITGAALNTVDYFLIDKLTQGWKPNQFVGGTLREFLEKESGQG
jgi:hypothetical protein